MKEAAEMKKDDSASGEGQTLPSYQTIVFVAQKFATSPEYFVGLTDDPEPMELVISRESDPELFAMVRDIISTDNPARGRLLAYYKKIPGEE